MSDVIRFIDLFAGVGGFHYGIKRACNQSTDEEPEQAKSDEDLPLREREIIQEVSRSGRGIRTSDEVERNILPSDTGGMRTVHIDRKGERYDNTENSTLQQERTGNAPRRTDDTEQDRNIEYRTGRSGENKSDVCGDGSKDTWPQQEQNGKTKFISYKGDSGNTQTTIGKPTGFRCVYSNEWDKYANSVYRKHYGQCDQSDIRTVDAHTIPDHDLLCGGFPCQSFSIAGKRGGFDDTRGTLFFDIARILKEKQPRLCLLENVKGLLSHDNGRTIKVILTTLTDLGYDVQWQVCNSKDFGVPQNRERIIIVGHLRGTSRPQVFPIGEDDKLSDGKDKSKERQSQAEISHALKGSSMKADNVFVVQNLYDVSYTSRVREYNEIAPTVRDYGSGGNKMPMVNGIRRLTPVECERLQGFPDNWTKYGADEEEISDTQRYKMMGNAVTTNVVTAIARRLLL